MLELTPGHIDFFCSLPPHRGWDVSLYNVGLGPLSKYTSNVMHHPHSLRSIDFKQHTDHLRCTLQNGIWTLDKRPPFWGWMNKEHLLKSRCLLQHSQLLSWGYNNTSARVIKKMLKKIQLEQRLYYMHYLHNWRTSYIQNAQGAWAILPQLSCSFYTGISN